MKQKAMGGLLALVLLLPEVLLAQNGIQQVASARPQPPAASSPAAQNSAQAPTSVRPQSASQRRPYERETRPHHRRGISKKEVAFMAAIAGTSMGIGALAAGAKGLAIGAIVGGWGAYVGHRVWGWVR